MQDPHPSTLLLRSLLFCPANRPERWLKALNSGADQVVIDLEDSIPNTEKDPSRQAVQAMLTSGAPVKPGDFGLRINHANTAAGIRDLAMLADAPQWPGFIVLPKVESSDGFDQIQALAAERNTRIHVILTLETARGVEYASRFLPDTGGYSVAFGSADYTLDTGAELATDALAWARGRIINACAIKGVSAIDGVCLDITSQPLLQQEAELARRLGFVGKMAIHPRQIETINRVFTPSPDEQQRARAIVNADDKAHGQACLLDGKMIDKPVVIRARHTLAMCESTHQRTGDSPCQHPTSAAD